MVLNYRHSVWGRVLLAAAFVAGLTMCGAPEVVKRAEPATVAEVETYVNGPMGRYSSRFGGVFYCGSDGAFDYVAIRHQSSTVRVFRIERGRLVIHQRSSLLADETKWVDITSTFAAQR